MNIDATEATLRAVTEAFKLASLLDPRVPHPAKAGIAAWAEQIERHRLNQADLLDGLRDFYDNPREHAIGVGDLIQHARQVRRARLAREDDAAERQARDAYNAALAARNKEQLDEICGTIAATRSTGQPRTTPLRRTHHKTRLEVVQEIRAAAPAATITITPEYDPLMCGLCGQRELITNTETDHGVCERCWPTIAGHSHSGKNRRDDGLSNDGGTA